MHTSLDKTILTMCIHDDLKTLTIHSVYRFKSILAKFHEASGIENDARKYALPGEHSHAATFTLGCVMHDYKHEYVDGI